MSFYADDRANIHRGECQREQPMSYRTSRRHLSRRALFVDVNPLFIAGRFCEPVDAVLCNLDPVADPDFGANRRLKFVKIAKVAHFMALVQCKVSDHCGTFDGIMSSASVAATTSATLMPGAVSSRVARPSGNPITAMSVTTIFTGLAEVSGNVHCFTIFDLPFAACCIATITCFAPATRSMAPPMPGTILPGIIQLAR